MFSKKYSEKYVKTLQEKNERLFEDLENAHKQVDQLTAAKERLESLAYKRGDKIRYLEDVVEIGEQEVDHLKAVVKGLEEELEKASEESTPLTPEVICGMPTEDIQRFAEIFVEALKKESEDDSTYEYSKDNIRFSATFNGKTFSAPYSDTVANHIDNVMNLYWEGYRKVVDTLQQLSDSMEGQDTTAGFKNSIGVSVFSSRLGYSVPITLSINKRAEWSLI
ncbi:hypothetical protein BN19_097 [Streptococcus phage SP-QS1]|uniref:Uncharacterized protein n=1 Tax=Streptococcus phage SP-QS1 TaxID=1208587 RepID=S6CRF8_9CAUD|nr:hypothetical protein BN19_097 [Streptococcus phage SP-QS1]CCJ09750.1 hypothetical protein BN19_097 [Streptococcus phage SP-QS1]